MMIFREKMKKMTFGERKTKLRTNTSQKLDNTKSKKAHSKPKKKSPNPRRGSCAKTITETSVEVTIWQLIVAS